MRTMKSITKIVLTSVAASVFFISVTATSVYAKNHADRIRIDYVAPDDPQLRKIHDILKERRVLERLQEFLSPYRLPRDLDVQLTDCDGESDAWYGDDEITICYEYINVLWQRMPAETTPSGVAPIDTVIGPFMDTTLHEFAHALFDMLSIPVLGREEDAADQVGAYIYLQLGNEEAKRLITGTAHAFLVEAEVESADHQPTIVDYADEHGTPAQRAFNILCIAYGADTRGFSDLVERFRMPAERAEVCEDEYEQIQDAYEALIGPHIDQDMAEELFDRTWILKKPAQNK